MFNSVVVINKVIQHDKNTKKREQIEKILQNNQEISDNIDNIMGKFDVKSMLKSFDLLKPNGTLISTLAMTLLILPFIAKDLIWILSTSGLNKKDAFYELRNNPKINRRALPYGRGKRFWILLSDSDVVANLVRALVLDDTAVAKTGKHIERVSYVHNHVNSIINFVLGYRI